MKHKDICGDSWPLVKEGRAMKNRLRSLAVFLACVAMGLVCGWCCTQGLL